MVKKLFRRTSRKDLLQGEKLDEILDMSVRDFIRIYRPSSTTYITVSRGTRLYSLLKAIATGHPSVIIVIDQDRRPIGYLTDHHLLQTLQRKPRPRNILASFSVRQIIIPLEKSLDVPVEDIMDRRPPIVEMDQKIRDVVQLMQSLAIPAVLVVDESGKVRAVLTRKFLLSTILNRLLGEPLMI